MYVRFLCSARSKDITVNAIPGSLEYTTKGDDIEVTEAKVGGATPILRNGIIKSGSISVLVNEYVNSGATPPFSTIRQSLATLMKLRSPVGVGDYTIYVNGVAVSWHALVTVHCFGNPVSLVKLTWLGTIEA